MLEKHCRIQQHDLTQARRKDIATLYFHKKITADNSRFGGVHPLAALRSHQSNLATLIKQAIQNLPGDSKNVNDSESGDTAKLRSEDGYHERRKPDFISVTRGPGMRSSLGTGLDTAKGLAVAWQIPIVGVNHMQAHALTHQLVAVLQDTRDSPYSPSFPFLSLLLSGGHTLLVQSSGLSDHKVLAETSDIAVGDALDKIARSVLPNEILRASREVMYGRLLEKFVFPDRDPNYSYVAPLRRHEEVERRQSRWGWSIGIPLAETKNGTKSKSMEFSFSGLSSYCKQIVETRGGQMDIEERKHLGKEAMRIAFEHIASRVVIGLRHIEGTTATVAGQPQQRTPVSWHESVGTTSSDSVLYDNIKATPGSRLSDRHVEAGTKKSLPARNIEAEPRSALRQSLAGDGDDHSRMAESQSIRGTDLIVSGGVAANGFLRAV